MLRIPARLSVLLRVVALVLCVGYAASRLLAFRQIFFEHAGIPLTQQQVADAYNGTGDTRTQHIPKIVHQVFHNWNDPGKDNDTLPPDWAEVRQGCMRLNPGFEFKLWTERASRDFIETEYPWFLRTYDGYRYPVQRVDAVRYFLLLHYGGIYMDLDNGCKTDLTPLLYYPLWITDGGRGALSNNILAARPNHPFWQRLTQSLIRYNWNWIFPYATIHYASGQWFTTAVWEEYHALLPDPKENPELEHRLYRLLMDDRPGADPWIFFTQERGGTWVNWDNMLFLRLGDPKFWLTLLSVAGVVCALWLGWRYLRRRRGGYALLKSSPGSRVVV